MPGEVSQSYDPDPEPEEQEPRYAIVYDIDVLGEYSPETLKGEIRRLRNLLNDCWGAAGLLGSAATKQPYQAWEEPSDLLAEIYELSSDAEAYWNEEDRDDVEDE